MVVPVRPAGDDGAAANRASTEAEVLAVEGAVGVVDASVVASDAAVVADLVAGLARQITAEASEARVELLEDDCLGLDLADLLSDDPLGHLLEDNEALLDDLNLFGVADNVLLLLDHLGGVGVDEVAGAVEVVKVAHGRETTPVVERGARAGGDIPAKTNRLGHGTADEGGDREELDGKFGKHDELCMKEWVFEVC